MRLFFREYGSNVDKIIVIIHGLYGSSDNWHSIARELAKEYKVIVPDLPNHGRSPHYRRFDYDFLVQEVKLFLNSLKIKNAYFIGHSLGGRIVLFIAHKYPDLVNKAVIVDIPPRNLTDEGFLYKAEHQRIIKALLSLNLTEFENRYMIAKALRTIYGLSERLVSFLLKNIVRENGIFRWRINLKAIAENLHIIGKGFENFLPSKLKMPILFIKGEKSHYINEQDIRFIKENFPNAKVEVIPSAGHWLFVEQPDAFISLVRNFFG